MLVILQEMRFAQRARRETHTDQIAVLRTDLAADEVRIDPLNDPAVERDDRERQGPGRLSGSVLEQENVASDGFPPIRQRLSGTAVAKGNQHGGSAFDHVAIRCLSFAVERRRV